MRRRTWIASTTIALLLGPGLLGSSPSFTHQQSLVPTGAAAEAQFGLSVAISGDTLVVGAQDFSLGVECLWVGWLFGPICLPQFVLNPDRGSAFVWVRSNGAWTQQQKLVASDGAPNDGFGASVAIRGDRIVVGAPRANGKQGAAYVFSRRGSSWGEQKLTARNGAFSDRFGTSVAIGDETIVVGAPGTDDGLLMDTGSVYVFENSGGSWIPQEIVNAPRGAGDAFGSSVAISGSTIVVGAPGADIFGPHGTATIFARTIGVWAWQQTLFANDAAAGDRFGAAVAISGTIVVVGAPNDDDFGVVDQGSVYVFGGGRNGVWSQQQKLINLYAANSDGFGSSVATNGTMIAVGVPNDELFGSPNQGTALVYEWSIGAWRVHQWFLFTTGTVWPAFGASVAISEGTVVVGAPSRSIFGGSALVFDQNTRPTIWAEVVQRPSSFQSIRATLATVADAQDNHSALTVTVNGAASAVVNGVSISAIGVDAFGTVTADVAAYTTGASDTSFTLRVTDTGGLFAEATLVVRNFNINP